MDVFNTKKIGQLNSQIEEMQKSLKEYQAFLIDDILTARAEASKKYTGNRYKTYNTAVKEISKKYKGNADWGVFQTGNIIDLRAAFIISEGLNITGDKNEAKAELEFAEAFLRYNDLDREVPQEFAKEAEIEGKILLKLAWEEQEVNGKKGGAVSVRFIPWTQKNYKIETSKTTDDYLRYTKAVWTPSSGKEETLDEPEFVYKKFGGRVYDPNDAQPKVMKCLTQIEDLDMALRDWREIDRLYSSPTPEIECETKEQAAAIMEEIRKNPNFKIKKFIAHTGVLSFKGPDIRGIQSLENEILTLVKMISGTTGIPVHFLGLPDLLSNRAVASNLGQLILSSTSKEREIWKGAYEEVLAKSMVMFNEKVFAQKSGGLDPTKLKVDIPYPSEEAWEHFEKVWLPLWLAGKISDELALSKLPGINQKEEMDRRAADEETEFKKAMAENEELRLKLAEVETNQITGEEE